MAKEVVEGKDICIDESIFVQTLRHTNSTVFKIGLISAKIFSYSKHPIGKWLLRY